MTTLVWTNPFLQVNNVNHVGSYLDYTIDSEGNLTITKAYTGVPVLNSTNFSEIIDPYTGVAFVDAPTLMQFLGQTLFWY